MNKRLKRQLEAYRFHVRQRFMIDGAIGFSLAWLIHGMIG
jgi:hypothetical protein